MNKKLYKLIFSKRLNKLIAVGENATGLGKSGQSALVVGSVQDGLFFTGMLKLIAGAVAALFVSGASFAGGSSIALPAAALPTGASVAAGKATVLQAGNTLTVNQTTSQAIVNWNSFSIGSKAKVIINQPSASSVELDRVTGNNASQIFGQLSSNGQVVLVNPNGIVFGKDGSVSATGFTASTLGITDADFLAGNYNFVSDGSEGLIVNKGKLQTGSGGYVALLGAKVTNSGQIIAPDGTVYMGAAQAMTVPLSASGKIKLELTQSAVNAMVSNTAKGTIVAEGGQVYMQAAALNDAAASTANTASTATTRSVINVNNAGSIDVSGPQAGGVTLLADGGAIKVSGSITANSTNASNTGGQIVIGRDASTGILSATTDVSGATLTAKAGFVETSGEYLKSAGVKIQAGSWLLDPANVEINSSSTPYTAGDSVVLASAISAALGNGTSVTITTGGAGVSSSVTGGSISQATAGTGNTSDGNIMVNSTITSAYNGASAPTLTLMANNGITVGANINAAGGAGLNITMIANGLAITRSNSYGIVIPGAVNILANGSATDGSQYGNISLSGTSYAPGSVAYSSSVGVGIAIGSLSTYIGNTIKGNNLMIVGTSNVLQGQSGSGVLIAREATTLINTTGNTSISGTLNGGGGGSGVIVTGSDLGSGVFMSIGGSLAVTGIQSGNANNRESAVYLAGVQATASGNVYINATAANSDSLAININREAGALNSNGYSQKFISTNGYVAIQSNQGMIIGQDYAPGAIISGRSIFVDNTGGFINTVTGQIIPGNGYSSYNATVGNGWSGSWSSATGGVSFGSTGLGNISNNSTTGFFSITSASSVGAALTNAGTFSTFGSISLVGLTSSNGAAALNITGDITNTAGVVNLIGGNTNSLVSAGVNLMGRVYAGGNINISGGLIGAGGISSANGMTLTFNNSLGVDAFPNYSGIITGSLAVVNQTGLQVFSGLNNYTGPTSISGGTLQIGNGVNAGALGPGAVTLANGATLSYQMGVDTTINNSISGSGNVVANITGTLTVAQPMALIGDSTVTPSISLTSTGAMTQTAALSIANVSSVNTKISLTTTGSGAGITTNTIRGSAAGSGQVNVMVESNGGAIAANGNISAYNISLDNTNGIIDPLSGVISASSGKLTSGSGITGAVHASSLDAVNNINIAGSSGNGAPYGVYLTGGSGEYIHAANAINIYGSTTYSHGVDILGAALDAGGPISILGKKINNTDLGVIIWFGSTITADYNGANYASGANAISISGDGSRGVIINNATIANNSHGGNTSITSTGGGDGNLQLDNGAVITNSASAGAINLSAKGYDINHVGAVVGAINTTTNGPLPIITQNSNAGVMITSDYGNVAPPKIVNNGTGSVIIAAGSMQVTGESTGGQIVSSTYVVQNGIQTTTLIPALNPIASNGPIYLYSGAASLTGGLSNINSNFGTLFLAGSGSSVNAQLSTAYTSPVNTISNGANTQVLFRSATGDTGNVPNFSLALNNLSQTYNGLVGPLGSTLISALANAYTGVGTLTSTVGSNTFSMLAATAIQNLNVSSASVNQSNVLNVNGGVPYVYSGISGPQYVSLNGQPSITVTPAPLGVSVNAIYQGLGTTINGSANITLTGLVGSDAGGAAGSVTLSSAGNATTGGANSVSSITPANGGWLASNYVINASPTSANAASVAGVVTSSSGTFTNNTGTNSVVITPATLTYNAAAATSSYGAAPVANGGTITGYVGNDNLNSVTQAAATTGTATWTTTASHVSNVGTYAITGSGLAAVNGNYVFAQAASNGNAASVTPALLSVSGLTGIYSGTTTLSPTSTTLQGVNGQTITFTSANIASQNVNANGSNYVTSLNGASVSGGSGSPYQQLANYTLSGMTNLNAISGGVPSATNSVILMPATANVSAVKTYNAGTDLSNSQVTITGVNGQVLGYTGTATLSNANVSANGSNYVQTSNMTLVNGGSGATSSLASNYVMPSSAYSTANTVTVNPYNGLVVVTGNSATQTYSGQVQSVSGFTATGLVGSDVGLGANGTLSGFSAAGAQGTNVINPNTGSAGYANVVSGSNGNYSNVTLVNGLLNITPAMLNLSALTATYNNTTTVIPTNTTLQGVNGQTIGFTSVNIAYSAVSANGTNYVTSLNGLSVSGGTGTLSLSNYTIPGMTSLASNVGGTFSNSPGAANSVTLTTPSNSQNVNPLTPVAVPGSAASASRAVGVNSVGNNFAVAGLDNVDGAGEEFSNSCECTNQVDQETCANLHKKELSTTGDKLKEPDTCHKKSSGLLYTRGAQLGDAGR